MYLQFLDRIRYLFVLFRIKNISNSQIHNERFSKILYLSQWAEKVQNFYFLLSRAGSNNIMIENILYLDVKWTFFAYDYLRLFYLLLGVL